MKQFTRRVRRYGRAFINIKTLVALCGIILSIVLHELFHIVMHWGAIQKVEVFTGHGAIVSITSSVPHGYNIQHEELVAYGITLVTLLITAAIIGAMHDKKDHRTALQIIFPGKTGVSTREFYELAARINLI